MKITEKVVQPTFRHDFVLLFDVKDGNPNGDPDNGNLPRVDPETMQGIVTDICIKRKVRDYVNLTRRSDEKRQIYVKHRGILTRQQQKAYEEKHIEDDGKPTTIKDARDWMMQNYYDIRMFGALMNTKKYNSGQVRGPIQLTFARSIDRINPQDISITRVALTNADDITIGSAEDEEARSGMMGRKPFLPYGLYMAYGFYSPAFAEDTGVSEEDLELFWESLMNMWNIDRSATRGMMTCQGLYVFTHDSKYGSAQAQHLFDRIKPQLKASAEVPRSFHDYEVIVRDNDLPQGITLTRLIG